MSLFWSWLTLISSIWLSYGLALEQGNISEKSLFMLCVNNLGPIVVSPFRYSMRTGCDVTSFKFGIGKKDSMEYMPFISTPLTDTCIALLEDPETLDLYPGHMEHLECFTVLMYSKNCNSGSVNEARNLLFTHSL